VELEHQQSSGVQGRRTTRTGPPGSCSSRDVTAEDIAANLIGIFTVAPKPQRADLASRLLTLLMDGLRPPAGR
jgi:hypothetical protein